MKYIGRIITKSKKIETIPDYVEITSDIKKIDDAIPTLIIGRELATKIYGEDKVRILNREISKNIFWTVGKFEMRTMYEIDLEAFNEKVYNNLLKGVEYKCLNIYQCGYNDIKRYYQWLQCCSPKVVYQYRDHIYIYDRGKVFGIALRELECLGISRKHIYRVILQNPLNYFLRDDDFLNSDIKKSINYNRVLIPYLYFLKEN